MFHRPLKSNLTRRRGLEGWSLDFRADRVAKFASFHASFGSSPQDGDASWGNKLTFDPCEGQGRIGQSGRQRATLVSAIRRVSTAIFGQPSRSFTPMIHKTNLAFVARPRDDRRRGTFYFFFSKEASSTVDVVFVLGRQVSIWLLTMRLDSGILFVLFGVTLDLTNEKLRVHVCIHVYCIIISDFDVRRLIDLFRHCRL